MELPSHFNQIELIILDMDGVVTSEESYWDTAGLVVRDIIESPAFLGLNPPNYTPISEVFYHRLASASRWEMRKYLPSDLILHCKSRGINSNWDLAYLTAGLYIAPILSSPLSFFSRKYGQETSANSHLAQWREYSYERNWEEEDEEDLIKKENSLKEHLSPAWDRLCKLAHTQEWQSFFRLRDFHLWGSFFREQKRTIVPVKNIALRIIDDFHPDIRGLRLLDELNSLMWDHQIHKRLPVFGRKTALWEDCRNLFQRWYLGEKLYEKTYGAPLIYKPKPGLIHHEEPLLGRDRTHRCLSKLHQSGFKLGIATGRPKMEIMTPLSEWDMIQYFDQNRIVTHDDVEQAEIELKEHSFEKNIGKPHPYTFLRSIYPEQPTLDLINMDGIIPEGHKILVVGDAQADIWAAQKIGCCCAAVLSGAVGRVGRKMLEEAKPDVICQNVLELSDALVRLKKSHQ